MHAGTTDQYDVMSTEELKKKVQEKLGVLSEAIRNPQSISSFSSSGLTGGQEGDSTSIGDSAMPVKPKAVVIKAIEGAMGGGPEAIFQALVKEGCLPGYGADGGGGGKPEDKPDGDDMGMGMDKARMKAAEGIVAARPKPPEGGNPFAK